MATAWLEGLRGVAQFAGRRYPLMSGYSSIAHLDPLVKWTADEELAIARLRDGARLVVKLNDFIGRTIFFCGDYDPKITWLCKRLLRPGDMMLDIGANMGVVGMYCAGLVGPTGRVHAFEPQPQLAAMVRRSAEMNGYAHLTVHEVALSDEDGELPLYGRPGETATASLVSEEGKTAIGRVPVRTAGPCLESLDLPAVRVMKIDVEDHEEAVLRGAFDFLKRNTPGAVIFESHGHGVGFFDRKPVQLLASLGYDFFQIPKVKWRMHLMPVNAGRELGRGFDFVAIARDEQGAEMLARIGCAD